MITNTRLFDGFKILLCLLALVACRSSLYGQEIDYLPVGVFNISYDFQTKSNDSVWVGGRETESQLKNLLKRLNLDEEAVDGSIKYESMIQTFKFQYGLSNSLNIGLSIPNLSQKRSSSLTVNNASIANNKFVEDYQSAETEGMGDIDLFGIWRSMYTDDIDFRIGVEINADNAPYHYDRTDEVALGTGAQELKTYLHWKLYPRTIDMITDLKIQLSFTKNSDVIADTGESLTLKRGRSTYMHIKLSFNDDAFNYGGGTKMISQAETIVDDQKQGDGYLSYHLNAFINYGNMYQLEKGSVSQPWMVQLSLDNAFWGANAPQTTTLGLKMFLYF